MNILLLHLLYCHLGHHCTLLYMCRLMIKYLQWKLILILVHCIRSSLIKLTRNTFLVNHNDCIIVASDSKHILGNRYRFTGAWKSLFAMKTEEMLLILLVVGEEVPSLLCCDWLNCLCLEPDSLERLLQEYKDVLEDKLATLKDLNSKPQYMLTKSLYPIFIRRMDSCP